MPQAPKPALARPAKERILEAAVRLFSRKSYDTIAWREIAADAQVDVAYVHRSFGTKQELFRQVLRRADAAKRAEELRATPRDALPRLLARRIVARTTEQRQPDEFGAFDIALLSSSSVEARSAVQDFVEQEFLAPLAQKLGHDDDMSRAALIISVLGGIEIMRSVIGIRSMAMMDEDWLAGAIEQLIRCATALPRPDPAPPAPPSNAATPPGRR